MSLRLSILFFLAALTVTASQPLEDEENVGVDYRLGPCLVDYARSGPNKIVLYADTMETDLSTETAVLLKCIRVPVRTISGSFPDDLVDDWMEIATSAEVDLRNLLSSNRFARVYGPWTELDRPSGGLRRTVQAATVILYPTPDHDVVGVDWVRHAISQGYSFNRCPQIDRYEDAETSAREGLKGIWGKPKLLKALREAHERDPYVER